MGLNQSNEQSPLYPVICGTVALFSQAAAINSTVLFPSAPPGVYRVSATLIVTTIGSSGNLVANLIGTDDLQAETLPIATIASIGSTGQANGVQILENTATANISYSVTAGGTFGSARFSLYLILERLF